jgi:PAS domain S-box-containing protein
VDFGVGLMRDEPEIVKWLREAELLGNLHGRSQSSSERLQVPEKFLDEKTICYVRNDLGRTKSQDDTHCEITVEELRKNEERFRSLVETTNDWMWEIDKNAVYTYSSPKVNDLLGYKPREIIGKTPFDLVPTDETKRVAKIFQDIIKTKKPFIALEKTNLHKSGKRVVIETSGVPFFDPNGDLLGYRGIDRDITDRKKWEEVLKANEQKYRILVENLPQKIFVKDKNSTYISCNENYARDLKIKSNEIIGKTDYDFYPKKLAEKYRADDKRIMKLGTINDFEEKYIQNGQERFVHTIKTPIKDENGALYGVMGIFYDITEQKKTQEAIQQSEERYRAMFESANDGIIIMEKKGRITDINQTASDLFGYSQKEFIGKNLKEVMHLFTRRSQARVLKNFALRMFGKHIPPYEVKMYTSTGEIIDIEINAVPLRKDGQVIGDMAILRDVTFRKKAEKDLKENEERLRTVLEAVKEGITFSDELGRFEVFNSEMESLTGHSMKEANDSSDFNLLLYPDPEKRRKALDGLNQLSKPGDIYKTETMIHTKGGIDRDVLISTTIVLHKNRKMFLSAYRDITERKKTEEALKNYQRKIELQNIKLKKLDKIKSDFLNVTSHELRTPMSAIKGYIQMILKQTLGDVTEEQEKALDVVLRNTNRLDNLIQDILDISRLESGTMKFLPEQTDLEKMVNEAVETMQPNAETKNMIINEDIEGNLPNLIIDSERIKQVIVNIVNNALKFSPDGSIVNVRAKKLEDEVLFEIEDNGRGIPKDKQKKIFDTFYQVDGGMDRKFGGAGLGLAICRGIILSHGGQIWVDSAGKLGEGSIFRFTLPFMPVHDIEGKFREVDIFGLEESMDEKEKDLRKRMHVR